jgi:ketosteroid isomerase-like protein
MAGFKKPSSSRALYFKIALALFLAGAALIWFSLRTQKRDYFRSKPLATHAGHSYTNLWYDGESTLVGSRQNGARLIFERWAPKVSQPETLSVTLEPEPGPLPWAVAPGMGQVAWISEAKLALGTPSAEEAGPAPLIIGLPAARTPLALGFLSDRSVAVVFKDASIERWNAGTGMPAGPTQHLPISSIENAVFRGDDLAISSDQARSLQLFHFHGEGGWNVLATFPIPNLPFKLLLPVPGVMGALTAAGLHFQGNTWSMPGAVRSVHAIRYDVMASGEFEGVQVLQPGDERYEVARVPAGGLLAGSTTRLAVSDASGTTEFELQAEQRLTARGTRLAWAGAIAVIIAALGAAVGLILEGDLLEWLFASVGKQRQIRVAVALERPDPDLIIACAEGNGVLWAGAGLSIASGFPTRNGFLLSLLQTAASEDWADGPVLRKLVAEAGRGRGEESLRQLLTLAPARRTSCLEVLRAVYDRFATLSRTHSALRRIGFAAAVTTNYDGLLERLDEPWTRNVAALNEPPPSAGLQEPFLLKLWGETSKLRSVILTQEEFTKAAADSPVTATLREVFRKRTFLFLGASLEGLVRDLERLGLPSVQGRKHFAVTGVTSQDWHRHADRLKAQFGIQAVVCAAETFPGQTGAVRERARGSCREAARRSRPFARIAGRARLILSRKSPSSPSGAGSCILAMPRASGPREGVTHMKKVLPAGSLLLAAAVLLGQSRTGPNPVEQTLIQLEHEWSRADTEKDAAALNRILAEDWIGIDFEGTVLTKPQALRGLVSDAASLESTVLKEMKVRVYGDTAVVTGTDTEQGQYHGKDSSGVYVWTDVFVRRDGRWQAVSSQSTRLARDDKSRIFARFSGALHARR